MTDLLTRPRLPVKEKPPKLCYRSTEFRAADEAPTDGRTLEGYGAVFDSPTLIESFFGDFEEEIARGSFKRTLRAKKPVLQFDHGRDARTGSLPIGSIQELREDDHGLFVNARLFDNDVVEPIRQAIEAQAIDGMSFRFRIMRDEWRDADGEEIDTDSDEFFDILFEGADHERGPLLRTIREVELFELGPVVFPAYDTTSVGVRSLLNELPHDSQVKMIRELRDEICGCDTSSRSTETPAGSADDGTPDDTIRTDTEPAASSTSAPVTSATRHVTHLGTPSWYLPSPGTDAR